MSELFLKENPTLGDLQAYVAEMKEARGFNTTDRVYETVLFAEEAGELVKAIRKSLNKATLDAAFKPGESDIADEMADVLILLLSLAHMHGIDVEQAFRAKEEKNKERVWRKNDGK